MTSLIFLNLLEGYAEELGQPVLGEAHFTASLTQLLANEAIRIGWLSGIVAGIID
ncbi:hypothetical protein HY30_01630 [Hyphomonas chukchiensis]|uniref:Uncharacterized protein n=1 Tax=Hyphomonas chukchiensis TaxID=1280947 RepID=A0A062UGF8_9PROT|nr:hypothetical protein HY30_01630 [Hyphomonas chukchiensis]